MRSVGLVALGWRVPGGQAQGMVRGVCNREVEGSMSVDLGDVCVSTYVRLPFRAPALRVFTLAAQVHKLRQFFHAYYEAHIPHHNRSVRMHHSRFCPKHCAPGGRSGTAHMAMYIAHSSATYGSAHRAPLAHRRSLRAVRTLSLSQSCPIPPARAPERSPSSTPHGRHRSHF
jgi:hypothetical protein